MIDQVVIQPQTDTLEPATSGVSWASIVAGAVAACAITLVLLAFGLALGLSVVSPWEGSGISATTFKITTGLYLIVIAMLSSSIGGYLAGRLRTRWIGVHSDEVYFRDTAHGFMAWALASVLGVALLASPAGHIVGGAASSATQAAAMSANSPSTGAADIYVDTLFRTDATATTTAPTTLAPGAAPQGNASNTEQRAEISRLLTTSFSRGDTVSGPNRDYLVKTVSARTGLSQADADARVTQVLTEAKKDIDTARKSTAQLAFWLTASLVLGAFCASLAATEGGGLRDGTWGNARLRR